MSSFQIHHWWISLWVAYLMMWAAGGFSARPCGEATMAKGHLDYVLRASVEYLRVLVWMRWVFSTLKTFQRPLGIKSYLGEATPHWQRGETLEKPSEKASPNMLYKQRTSAFGSCSYKWALGGLWSREWNPHIKRYTSVILDFIPSTPIACHLSGVYLFIWLIRRYYTLYCRLTNLLSLPQ